jgi:spore cortex protein
LNKKCFILPIVGFMSLGLVGCANNGNMAGDGNPDRDRVTTLGNYGDNNRNNRYYGPQVLDNDTVHYRYNGGTGPEMRGNQIGITSNHGNTDAIIRRGDNNGATLQNRNNGSRIRGNNNNATNDNRDSGLRLRGDNTDTTNINGNNGPRVLGDNNSIADDNRRLAPQIRGNNNRTVRDGRINNVNNRNNVNDRMNVNNRNNVNTRINNVNNRNNANTRINNVNNRNNANDRNINHQKTGYDFLRPFGYYSNENHNSGNARILDDNDGPIIELMDHMFGDEGQVERNRNMRTLQTRDENGNPGNPTKPLAKTDRNFFQKDNRFSTSDVNYHGHLDANNSRIRSANNTVNDIQLADKLDHATASVVNVEDVHSIVYKNSVIIAVDLKDLSKETEARQQILKAVEPYVKGRTVNVISDEGTFTRIRDIDYRLRAGDLRDGLDANMRDIFDGINKRGR